MGKRKSKKGSRKGKASKASKSASTVTTSEQAPVVRQTHTTPAGQPPPALPMPRLVQSQIFVDPATQHASPPAPFPAARPAPVQRTQPAQYHPTQHQPTQHQPTQPGQFPAIQPPPFHASYPTMPRLTPQATWSATNVRSALPLQAPPPPQAGAPTSGVETNLARVFEKLAAILVPYALSMETEMHPKIGYCLKIPATGKSGKEMHFGGVQLQDDGVAFHLFALYSHPELLKGVSLALVNAMRGMTCFFIEALSPEHLQELAALTQASFERFRSDGLV